MSELINLPGETSSNKAVYEAICEIIEELNKYSDPQVLAVDALLDGWDERRSLANTLHNLEQGQAALSHLEQLLYPSRVYVSQICQFIKHMHQMCPSYFGEDNKDPVTRQHLDRALLFLHEALKGMRQASSPVGKPPNPY